METIEERNLNRLRNGKMMLEYSDQKKSHIMAFTLAIFFAALGAHRFYLGQIKIGVILLVMTIVLPSLFYARPNEVIGYLVGVLTFWIIVEIVLVPYFTSRVNRKLKTDLMTKYGVKNI